MGHTAGNELPVSVCVVKKQAVHHQVKGITLHTKKVIRKTTTMILTHQTLSSL